MEDIEMPDGQRMKQLKKVAINIYVLFKTVK